VIVPGRAGAVEDGKPAAGLVAGMVAVPGTGLLAEAVAAVVAAAVAGSVWMGSFVWDGPGSSVAWAGMSISASPEQAASSRTAKR
jgi:hypothetical protein